MQPYYQDESITLYNADCLDVLPHLTGQYFTFTDPPYNVGKDYKGWNDSMPHEAYLEFCAIWIEHIKRLSPEACIYPPKKFLPQYWNMVGTEWQQIVLTWKPEGAIRYGFVDQYAVLLTNARPKQRAKNLWENVQMRGMGYFFKENDYNHPGYTSEDLTRRVLTVLGTPDYPVLEPFAGTGTTARVAKNLGRKCVAIEYSEQWCEFIARERMAQGVLI
jgi:DNA modification methylase